LVGNKIDVRGHDIANDELEEQVMPIMNEFKEVETCVECSAKQPLNVSEVFYFAQKAVLHPTAPLYDSREHVLKPACIDALRRIFKLCDIDKNGFLDDDEIDNFQVLGTKLAQMLWISFTKARIRKCESSCEAK
jgi:Ras family protein T1